METLNETDNGRVTGEGIRLERPSSGGWPELVRFLSNPLTYLPRIAQENQGPLVPFRLGDLPCTLVVDPEYVQKGLLNEDWPPISRGRLTNITNWFLGGLFVNEGKEHHRQRDDIWKPILEDPSIPELTASTADAWVKEWKAGQTVEMFKETRALAYAIDWKAFTGEDVRSTPGLLAALETGAGTLPWLILPLGKLRWKLPLPATLRAKRDQSILRKKITALIAERRSAGRTDDLLGKMVARRDAPGNQTTDDQLFSTVVMYFGADQLHAMFAWTFYLLSQNPEVERRLHEEVDALSGPPSVDEVRGLDYTRRVLKESMRLMPPVWGFFRELRSDYLLGDTVLPKGSLMGFSPWVTQRDARYWPDPLKFDPDRWLPDAPKAHPMAYFPFSAGPYWCHGGHLAMIEAVQITAIIARRWKLRPARSSPPKAIATWCTEPKGGLPMVLEGRG